MRNFYDTFKTHKRSFISAFLICMTVSLGVKNNAKYLSDFLAELKKRFNENKNSHYDIIKKIVSLKE